MNRYQIDLIEDPPPKCVYFTLPDPKFFLTPEDIARHKEKRVVHASLIDLFGPFDKMSDDQQTQFLLSLLKHSSFVPNYDAMAKDLNLANGNIVRRRYVAIAEKQGFAIEGESVKARDESTPGQSEKSNSSKTEDLVQMQMQTSPLASENVDSPIRQQSASTSDGKRKSVETTGHKRRLNPEHLGLQSNPDHRYAECRAINLDASLYDAMSHHPIDHLAMSRRIIDHHEGGYCAYNNYALSNHGDGTYDDQLHVSNDVGTAHSEPERNGADAYGEVPQTPANGSTSGYPALED